MAKTICAWPSRWVRRAALAVDNARLWEETRKAVEERELALKLHCEIERTAHASRRGLRQLECIA